MTSYDKSGYEPSTVGLLARSYVADTKNGPWEVKSMRENKMQEARGVAAGDTVEDENDDDDEDNDDDCTEVLASKEKAGWH